MTKSSMFSNGISAANMVRALVNVVSDTKISTCAARPGSELVWLFSWRSKLLVIMAATMVKTMPSTISIGKSLERWWKCSRSNDSRMLFLMEGT